MTMEPERLCVLLVSADTRLCALPLVHVRETMRPLPYHPVPNAPRFVLGVSTMRSVATPVADLGLLVGDRALQAPSRLVSLRLPDSRSVALLVDTVRGVHYLEPRGTFPPLLRDAAVIQELARLDTQLLTVLDAGRLLTDAEWQELTQSRVGS